MKMPIHAFILAAAAAVTFAGCGTANAQSAGGPPPQMRAQMQQIRANAKTAAFNALTPDHRTRVQAVIDQFNSRSIDRATAVQQIDAILSPAEAQAVLAQQTKERDAMRGLFSQYTSQNGKPHHMGNRTHTPDAGRALLMLGSKFRGHRPQ